MSADEPADIETSTEGIDGTLEAMSEQLNGLRADIQMGSCLIASAVALGGGQDWDDDANWMKAVTRRATMLYAALPVAEDDEDEIEPDEDEDPN